MGASILLDISRDIGLVDCAEDRLPANVEHLNADVIAEFHETGPRLAFVDEFNRPTLSDTG